MLFFLDWLKIFFVVPFKDLEILWILIPIWISLIFTDFYQEKKGTSLGNAVTNGAVSLWVAIDWIRFLLRNYEGFTGVFAVKILLCVFVIAGGIFIIIEGIKAKKFIHIVGRIRETSYVLLVISPVIYGVVEPTLRYLLGIVVFFPVFYFVFELIDRVLPNPKTYEEDSDGDTDMGKGMDTGKDLSGSPSSGLDDFKM